MKIILLMPAEVANSLLAQLGSDSKSEVIETVGALEELRDSCASLAPTLVLSFGTGVIVPPDILKLDGLCALNVHAASPAYPGRDPHHFAAYDGVGEYGATLHYMTPAIDQGPIVDVELFPVPARAAPRELQELANAAGLRLAQVALRNFLRHGPPPPSASLCWTGPVRRRRDFLELCTVDPSMSEAEFERRLHACSMPGYRNMRTILHGRTFMLE